MRAAYNESLLVRRHCVSSKPSNTRHKRIPQNQADNYKCECIKDWTIFPWVYSSYATENIESHRAHVQIAHGAMDTQAYITEIRRLCSELYMTREEYQRSLHELYARNKIGATEYFKLRELFC